MHVFRISLVSILVSVIAYTGIVIAKHGWGLFEIFFGEMVSMTWQGQFNLDFMCFLILSGFWLAWRHHFNFIGNMLGLFMLVGGSPMLCTYLLWASYKAKGSMNEILLGKTRSAVASAVIR